MFCFSQVVQKQTLVEVENMMASCVRNICVKINQKVTIKMLEMF